MQIQQPSSNACPDCGAKLAPTMLACPGCARLVHADQLAALAQNAKASADRGDVSAALAAWREALDLLPATSKQHQVISAKITQLGQNIPFDAVPAAPSAQQQTPTLRAATGVGVIGVMLWKFKALIFGLGKGTTLLTMLLSLGVYSIAWDWKFALGLVLSIYVHEMGHVIALRRYGFKASAPMFIPGLGALIRLRQKVVNPREDAEIGLEGPIYGLGAAAVSLGLWLATGAPVFAAIASVGAAINLFNLLPIGSLDGGRGFHAMSRGQKFLAAATAAGARICVDERLELLSGLLFLLALIGVGRAFGDKSEREGSWKTATIFCGLIVALTALATIRSPAGLAP